MTFYILISFLENFSSGFLAVLNFHFNDISSLCFKGI